ncbi:hypothetical protein PanWU01x14_359880 [Parasponia andersonii]|uniref:Uncharacterized protein n=1 Tax=Parasponia andersonii TaxID=3476 RepID=A0A2P5A7X3_PARAD|nr:hypothetical protein PanWU01x14_359880 [Parasponia andersonii]
MVTFFTPALEESSLSNLKMFIWAKEGDVNTNLFHRLMNARKAKNSIIKLELEDGNFVDKEEDIVKEVTEFYQSLYKLAELDFRGFEGVDWKPISTGLKDWLERPFDEAEIRRVIFDCDGNKAPCLDGFTIAVFQANCDIIKEDLVSVFIEFEQDVVVHVGRWILDLILIANEIVEDYRKLGKAGVIFKIDYEKAYDCGGVDFSGLCWRKRVLGLGGGDGSWVDSVEVSHLQFAADTLFFLDVDRDKFMNLIKLLEGFLISLCAANQYEQKDIVGNQCERKIYNRWLLVWVVKWKIGPLSIWACLRGVILERLIFGNL